MNESPSQQRVVVTGIGLVTPFGPTRRQSWRSLREGASATRWLAPGEIEVPGSRADHWGRALSFVGAPVQPLPGFHPDENATGEPVVALALQAAGEALADAGIVQLEEEFSRQELPAGSQESGVSGRESRVLHHSGSRLLNSEFSLQLPPSARSRFGCVIGTSKGGMRSLSRALVRPGKISGTSEESGDLGRRFEDSPAWPNGGWPWFLPNMPAAAVAARYGLEGPCLCPVAACATGLAALNRGFELVRDGSCDVVLAGSSDASLCASVLASFRRMGVLARGFDDPRSACRPFDRLRSGFVVGEGAAVLVLERFDRAAARGAVPYAEWVAAGSATDTSGLTSLEEEPLGLIRLIRDLLRRAGLTASEVDYANLHGTATRPGDVCETRALKRALGRPARSLCCSSLKGGLGHLLGAAGSVETAATLLAIREGLVPPTVNLSIPDACCDLDYTPNIPRQKRIENALKLSLGFGGHLTAAVLRAVPT